jgi:hypothetical protein
LKNENLPKERKMYFQTFFSYFKFTFLISTFSPLLHILLLVCFMGQIGCATPEHDKQVYIAPELVQQFDNFRFEAHRRGLRVEITDIIVIFAAMDANEMIGYCWQRDNMTPIVAISREFWQTASLYQQEILMFHELGHCLLQKHHNNALDGNGMPRSIMNERMFDVYYYETYRESYLQQFFGRARLY